MTLTDILAAVGVFALGFVGAFLICSLVTSGLHWIARQL